MRIAESPRAETNWRTALTRRVRGPSAETLGASLFGQACLVVSGIIAARALGVDGRGILAILWLLPVTLALIGGLGIPQATTYFVAKDSAHAAGVIRISASTLATLAVILVCGYAFGLALFADGQNFSALDGLLSVALVPLFLAQNLATASLLGLERYRSFNVGRVAPLLLYAIATLVLFAVGLATLTSILGACLWSWVLGALGSWFLVQRELSDGEPPPGVTRSGILGFGVRGVIGTVSPVDDVRIDQLFVGFLLDARALGLYVAAVAFCNLPRFVAQSIGSVNYPRVAGAADLDLAWASAIRAAKIGLMTVAITVAVLILAIPFLLPLLFGDDFRDAVGLGFVLLPAAYFLSVHRLLTELARGLGRPGYGSISELANLAVFLICLVALASPPTATSIATAVLAGGITSALLLSCLLILLRRKQTRETQHEIEPAESPLRR